MDKLLFDNFFDVAPSLPGFKFGYTAVYMAALRVSSERGSVQMVDATNDVQTYAQVGRNLLLEALKWLSENGLISYKATPGGKIPSVIDLNSKSVNQISSKLSEDLQQPNKGFTANLSQTPSYAYTRTHAVSGNTSLQENNNISQQATLAHTHEGEGAGLAEQAEIVLNLGGRTFTEKQIRQFWRERYQGIPASTLVQRTKGALTFDEICDGAYHFILGRTTNKINSEGGLLNCLSWYVDDFCSGNAVKWEPKEPTPASAAQPFHRQHTETPIHQLPPSLTRNEVYDLFAGPRPQNYTA